MKSGKGGFLIFGAVIGFYLLAYIVYNAASTVTSNLEEITTKAKVINILDSKEILNVEFEFEKADFFFRY